MKSRDDLPLWLNSMGLTGVGVEVGSLRGQFAATILSSWRGYKLYLIDAWRQIDGWDDHMNAGLEVNLNRIRDCMLLMYPFKERACMIRDIEEDTTLLFQESSLDFVYLDANHSYEAVSGQIERWWPLIRPGGVLGTHDYLNGKAPNNSALYGVKQAFDEFADGLGLERIVTQEFGNQEPSCFLVKRVIDDRI